MTKEILNRLPDHVVKHIEMLRENYNNMELNHYVTRAGSVQYLHGLCDAGLITETERKILFCYTTI